MPDIRNSTVLGGTDNPAYPISKDEWNASMTVADGTVAAPALGPTSEPGSGIYRIAAGILGWAILGVERLRLSAAELLVSSSVSIKGPRPHVDIRAYGAVCDAVALTDGAITNATTAFTSASAAFTSANVGKRIAVSGAGVAGATLGTTIAAYVSATEVTLAAAASTTVSGARTSYGTDDSVAVRDAITAAAGGTVLLSGNTIGIASTITLSPTTQGTRFLGLSRRKTQLLKLADVTLFDVLGTHPVGTTTARLNDCEFRFFTLTGNNMVGWTAPLMRAMYAAGLKFDAVDFRDNYGEAIQGVEFWDSYFYGCRFDQCGKADGTAPAVSVMTGTGAASGIGHSAENCNNLWFVNCVWETFKTGAIWFWRPDSSAQRNNKNYLVNCKIETVVSVRGNFLRDEGSTFNSFVNLNCTAGAFDPGVITPVNLISFVNTQGNAIRGGFFETTAAAASTVRTVVSVAGGNADLSLDGIVGSMTVTNPVTVGLIEFSGTNNRVALGSYGYNFNPGAGPLLSGAPTTLAQRGASLFDSLAIPAGTVAVPLLYISTDSDTGVYLPAANSLAITAGAADVARFTNPGGTITEYITLAGATSADAAPVITVDGTNATNILQLRGKGANGDIYLGSQNTSFLVARGSASNAANLFVSGGTNSVLRLSSLGTGNVELWTGSIGRRQLAALDTASSVNYITVTGSATGAPGSATVGVAGSDSNIDLRLGIVGTGVVDLRYAVTALGAGGAATLGLTGGSGPATVAQNSWVAVKINGATSWIPIWR